MGQLVYTMLISNNCESLHLWWKESFVKPQKVSKYYAIDCSYKVIQKSLLWNYTFIPSITSPFPSWRYSFFRKKKKDFYYFFFLVADYLIPILAPIFVFGGFYAIGIIILVAAWCRYVFASLIQIKQCVIWTLSTEDLYT